MTDQPKPKPKAETAYSAEATLVRLNELIGELYALHDRIPQVSDVTRIPLNGALTAVRTTIAHAVALGFSKASERPTER